MPALRGPDGKVVYVGDDEVQRYTAGGEYTPVDSAAAGAAASKVAPVDTGAIGTIRAGLSSVLSGATLGGSDVVLESMGTRGQAEQLASERAQHPVLSAVGQGAGMVLPAVISGGAATPSGYLSKLAGESIEAGRAIGGARGAALGLAAAGSEGALQNAGIYLSEVALGDRDLSAEGVTGALGTGFAFGVGGAAAAHGVEAGTIAARRMFARYAEGGERAAEQAAQQWSEGSQAHLEAFDQTAELAQAKLTAARAAREQAALGSQRAAADLADARAGIPAAAPEAAAAAPGAIAQPPAPPVEPPHVQVARMLSDRARAAVNPESAAAWDAANGAKLQSLMEAQAPRVFTSRVEPPVAADATGTIVQPHPGGALGALADIKAEVELGAKLSEYRAARQAFDEVHAQVDPDLEAALHGLGEPDVQRPPVPVGEFGAPGAGGFKTPDELARLAAGPETPVSAPAAEAPGTRVLRGGAKGTPAGAPPLAELTDVSAPPAGTSGIPERAHIGGKYKAIRPEPTVVEAPGAATPTGGDLDALLRATQEQVGAGRSIGEIGAASPARAEYVANKAARTQEAAAHFRAKAIAGRDVPEYEAISAHEGKADAPLERTVPARVIAERGYYEPPIKMERPGMALEEADPVRMANARKAIKEGQREPIDLNVTPSGKITVTGGRHRLQAAIEADAPIKVRWSTGAEPAESDVFRASRAAADPNKTTAFKIEDSGLVFDRETRNYTDPTGRASELTPPGTKKVGLLPRAEPSEPLTVVREHPLSVKNLEMAHDAALERAATAVEPAERVAAQEEAAAIEKQLTGVGARPGAVEDVAAMAHVTTRFERAAADLTEVMGDAAPAFAREHAKAFRAAEEAASRKTVSRMAQAADDAAVGRTVEDPLLAKPGKSPRIAAAGKAKALADAALARARVAETEARIGAKSATEAAAKARSSMPKAPAKATEVGFGRKVVEGARTLGVTAELASDFGIPGVPRPHDIPVIGPILSAYLKYRALRAAAGRFVGRVPATAETRAAALAAKTRDGVARAVDRSLGIIERNPTAVRAVLTAGAIEVNKALSRRLIDDGGADAPKDASPPQLAAVRMREVAAAVANPQLIIDKVRSETHGILDPDLITALENHLMAMYQHLNEVAPKGPPPNPYTKTQWIPPAADALQWGRRLAVANNPTSAFEALSAHALSPGAAETLRAVYPKLFEAAQKRLIQRVEDLKHPVEYRQLMQSALLFDIALHPSLEPQNAAVLATAHALIAPAPSPTAPAAPAPSIANGTNLTNMYQTSADRRAAR